mmetsp:Transcript_20679/g.46005  ORF Transcript_20679/g.46005 Transcript_20679/m.46005 type:complete len:106 (+) Transcript_20679:1-318(+)
MDPEERSDPDIIVKMGGKKELVTEALRRRERLAEKTGLTPREIDNFIAEFQNMRRMMSKNLKGMDMDASNGDPNAPMVTQAARAAEAKKNRKIKPSRGGGGGFGG